MKKSISYIFILLSGICWGCIGLSNRMPASYTHLDVYKRQPMSWPTGC